jgi:hypothetical protein
MLYHNSFYFVVTDLVPNVDFPYAQPNTVKSQHMLGVILSPLGTLATVWPIVPALDDG